MDHANKAEGLKKFYKKISLKETILSMNIINYIKHTTMGAKKAPNGINKSYSS